MTVIAIIGLGLIGGSIARDLKSQLNVRVVGVDSNTSNASKALEIGLVHDIVTYEEAIKQAEIIVVAIPVNSIENYIGKILYDIPQNTTVIDVGSTKQKICEIVKDHPNRGRFVAAHPLAGTEFSGPTAALKGLFQNKKNIICDQKLSDDDAVSIAIKLFESIGMQSFFLSSIEHDKHLAYVSHLSHISSFTLSLTVLDIEKDENQIFNLASTGFESTARLAKSNPDTWTPIFEKNSEHLLEALEKYSEYLEKFKTIIKTKDKTALYQMMKDANDIKRVLDKN